MEKKISRRMLAVIIVAIAIIVAFGSVDALASTKPVTMNSAILSEDGSSIDIIWKKTDGVKRYDIYRAKYGSKSFSKIGSAKATSRSYTDKDISDYTTYQYKVKAVAKSGTSSYSKVVCAYTGDIEVLSEKNLKFKFEMGGDAYTHDSGDGITTTADKIKFTPIYKGKKLSSYTLYYDRSSLKITKSSGSFKVTVLKPGYHVITLKTGKIKGSFPLDSEKVPCECNFDIEWNANEYFSDLCFYPTLKNEVLTVLQNGKKTSNFSVKSSNTSIATVKKSGSKIYITNKHSGTCEIIISNGSRKDSVTWIVRRGNPTTTTAVDGVPYSSNISESKARKALKEITKTEFTYSEIKKMAKNDPALSFWEKKLSHPADVMQMLWALDFNAVGTSGKVDNRNVWANGYEWCSKLSPEENYEQRYLVCLSVSELMNQVLRNDMQEQGYVQYSSPGGGHAFCYYKVNGLYVYCDYASYIENKNCDFTNYVVYITDSKEDFAEYYIGSDKEYTTEKESGYIYMLDMVKTEGRTVPYADIDGVFALDGCGVSGVIPKTWLGQDINEVVDTLYLAPGFEPKYVDEPPVSTWTFL